MPMPAELITQHLAGIFILPEQILYAFCNLRIGCVDLEFLCLQIYWIKPAGREKINGANCSLNEPVPMRK